MGTSINPSTRYSNKERNRGKEEPVLGSRLRVEGGENEHEHAEL